MLRPLKPRQVLRALESAGFYIHHQKGSHARLFHQTRRDLRVTVPIHHAEDIQPSLLKRILRQAELTEADFLDLL
jgi:predicted RNA binding protein YcfA (HicA-like mRNA interferase family)